MLSLENDTYGSGIDCFLDLVGYLGCELLLELRFSGERIDYPCDLGKTEYLSVPGTIDNMRLAVERKQMTCTSWLVLDF